jgi:RNase adaptor protein for sRNA GlmZ degradation
LKEPLIDLVLDARCFPDPGAQHTTRHPGIHPDIIMRIVQHWNFNGYMKHVKAQWKKAVAKQKHDRPDQKELEFVVAVYCRSGKHRSVAIGECLRYIGERVEGLRFVAPVKHLSQKRWGNNMCKGGCEECKDEFQRRIYLEEAAAAWRRV